MSNKFFLRKYCCFYYFYPLLQKGDQGGFNASDINKCAAYNWYLKALQNDPGNQEYKEELQKLKKEIGMR
jgi:hypothetical protein